MRLNKLGGVLVLATFLAACAGSSPRSGSENRRIVTLVPAYAADLFAIGAGDRVVGVSKFSERVPGAAALPKVADFSTVDTERIVALHADRVVGIPAQAREVAALERAGIAVTLIPDDRFDDIFAAIATFGDLTGRRDAANELARRLRSRTAELERRTRSFTHHPSVFVVLGTGPIWTAGRGSFIGSLIERAGGRNAASDLAQPWGEYSEEALLRRQPDALVAGPEVHLNDVLTREPWRSLRAVKLHHVFVLRDRSTVDALYQPGPQYNEGLSWLIERLSAIAR